MTHTFPSKRDAWLVVVSWASAGALVAASALPLLRGESAWASAAVVAAFGLSAALLIWVLYGTGYTIDGHWLRVRSGPFRWNVALDSIHAVAPSSSPLSSPACSLDRLLVSYAGPHRMRALLVSPEDKTGFLAALAARCPALALEGDRLVSRARAR